MKDDNRQQIIWQLPQNPPVLKEDRVHIWRANLDLPPSEIKKLATFLSIDEIARANKFRFIQHQKRFIAARGILRQLLGNYLNTKPDRLVFKYGDCGKPLLAIEQHDRLLQFNISHSQEYALFGFTLNHLIGLDLEYLRMMPDAVKIAQRFFSQSEYEIIKNVVKEEQAKLFFQFWTAKEAYLKAVGTGLAGSLSNVEIALNKAKSPYLLAINGSSSAIVNWSLFPCIPATDYLGAIAINTNTSTRQIDFWDWHRDLPSMIISSSNGAGDRNL